MAELVVPVRSNEALIQAVEEIFASLPDSKLQKLWEYSRVPGSPALAQRDKNEEKIGSVRARKILMDGLKYHEHDGYNMPKRVVRNALIALGVKEEDQP